MWASLPPLDWWPLAWIAPLGWLIVARRRQLSGRRPYRVVYASGFVLWMATLHWLRLPHWAASFAWVVGASYLACGVLLFVYLVRVAVHRWRWPLMLAAPVVWTGLELIRGHLFGGFTMASLGHTQFRWLSLIQISDLVGSYGVSFVVMLGAAAIVTALPAGNQRWNPRPLLLFFVVLVTVIGYGQARLRMNNPRPGPSVALIQGSIDSLFKADPARDDRVHEEYLRLSRQAIGRKPDVDLVVWPETMFRKPLLVHQENVYPPEGADWDLEDLRRASAAHLADIATLANELGTALVLGIDAHEYGPGTLSTYNSVIHVSPSGQVLGRYDKMSPVMFGEYIPLAKYIPALYRITPLTGSIEAGTHAAGFIVSETCFSPSICYEDVLPHVIRRQITQLSGVGREVDVLVNLTNDGWYWGSSELDLHLICAVFRAVEFRKPMLIAANTGFSAWIDGDGRIVKQGPRRKSGVVFADVLLDDRGSWYLRFGDILAGICLLACLGLAASAVIDRIRRYRRSDVSTDLDH